MIIFVLLFDINFNWLFNCCLHQLAPIRVVFPALSQASRIAISRSLSSSLICCIQNSTLSSVNELLNTTQLIQRKTKKASVPCARSISNKLPSSVSENVSDYFSQIISINLTLILKALRTPSSINYPKGAMRLATTDIYTECI